LGERLALVLLGPVPDAALLEAGLRIGASFVSFRRAAYAHGTATVTILCLGDSHTYGLSCPRNSHPNPRGYVEIAHLVADAIAGRSRSLTPRSALPPLPIGGKPDARLCNRRGARSEEFPAVYSIRLQTGGPRQPSCADRFGLRTGGTSTCYGR
jgi:hypothetical protein